MNENIFMKNNDKYIEFKDFLELKAYIAELKNDE